MNQKDNEEAVKAIFSNFAPQTEAQAAYVRLMTEWATTGKNPIVTNEEGLALEMALCCEEPTPEILGAAAVAISMLSEERNAMWRMLREHGVEWPAH